jgi:PPOX class probable F420-dependent enzyme
MTGLASESTETKCSERLDLTRRHHAHIDRRLRTEPIIWLGSSRPDGRPHLVPVWFLWDGATVLIFSLPDTQKVRNLRQNPAAVLALNAADQGYDIVLLEGCATFVDDQRVRGTMPAFVEKYAQVPRRWAVDEWARKFSVPIQITPTRLVGWITRPGLPFERSALRF